MDRSRASAGMAGCESIVVLKSESVTTGFMAWLNQVRVGSIIIGQPDEWAIQVNFTDP